MQKSLLCQDFVEETHNSCDVTMKEEVEIILDVLQAHSACNPPQWTGLVHRLRSSS